MKYLLLFCFALSVVPLTAQWAFNFDQEGGTVYSLERAPNGALWAATGNGLYTSADDGQSWTLSPLVPKDYTVWVAKRSGNNLYLLATKSSGGSQWAVALIYSTDGGNTWTNQPFLRPDTPLSNRRSFDGLLQTGNTLFLDLGDYIYRTDDLGLHWTNICQADWNVTNFSGDGNLLIHREETHSGVIRVSADQGLSWTEPALPANTGFIRATFVHNNTLYLADSQGRILHSGNLGAAWTVTTLPGINYSSSAHFRRDNATNILYVSAGARLFASADNGASWSVAAPDAPAPLLDFTPAGNRIFGACTSGFIYLEKNSNAWEIRNQGIRARTADLLKTLGDDVFTAFGNRVFRSADGGDNWAELPIPVLQNNPQAKVIDLTKNGDELFVMTNSGVIRSADNGASWPAQYDIHTPGARMRIGPGNTFLIEDYGYLFIYDLFSLSPVNDHHLLIELNNNPYELGNSFFPLYNGNAPYRILTIGSLTGKIYQSNDWGQSWSLRSTGVWGGGGRFIDLHDALAVLTDDGFFLSFDNGLNWESGLNGALASYGSVADIFASPPGSGNYGWYAANWRGVFRRAGAWDEWQALNDRLPSLNCLEVGYAQGYIFAALKDKGIWRREDAAPLSPIAPETVSGPDQLCAGEQAVYCIPGQPGALYYQWQAPAGASINGGGNKAILPAPGGACVTITFSDGFGEVSVNYHHEQVSAALKASKTVKNRVPATVLLPQTLPYENLPAVWPVNGQLYPNDYGTYVLEAVFTAANGCDSVVKQTLTIKPPLATTATGFVYWDDNNNGQFDSGELKYAGGAAIQSGSGPATVSDGAGNFLLTGLNSGEVLSLAPPLPNTSVNPPSRVFTDLAGGPYSFGIYAPAGYRDLSVQFASYDVFRPGFTSTLYLLSQNLLPAGVANATVTLVLPPGVTLESASLTPVSVSGNTIAWNLGTMAGLSNKTIKVTVKTDAGVAIGTPLEWTAAINPVNGDTDPANNTYTLQVQVVGSYDPNDKSVNPLYVTPEMLSGSRSFEYTVRFQNTGNYPAEMVRIVDTLSPLLDWAGFRFIASSHPCTWKLQPSGVIEFFFDKINLPDSVSNEPESHGFVTFSIRPKPGLAVGDAVENLADIYFDYNRPIRTNTAGTQVVYFLPDDPPAGNDMSARPNPASYVIHFAWLTPLREPGVLRLFTLNGVPTAEMPVAAGLAGVDLYVADQPPGVYIAVLESAGKRYVRTVVVQRVGLGVRRMREN